MEVCGNTSEGYPLAGFLVYRLRSAAIALLATVTVTFRWNDGVANRTLPVTLALTVLGTTTGVLSLPIVMAPESSLTAEADLTGSAQYELQCSVCGTS